MHTFEDVELEQEFIFLHDKDNILWRKYNSEWAIRMEKDPFKENCYKEIPGYVIEVSKDTQVFFISDYRF